MQEKKSATKTVHYRLQEGGTRQIVDEYIHVQETTYQARSRAPNHMLDSHQNNVHMLRKNESELSILTAYENLHRCQDHARQSTMQPLLIGTMPIQSFELLRSDSHMLKVQHTSTWTFFFTGFQHSFVEVSRVFQ